MDFILQGIERLLGGIFGGIGDGLDSLFGGLGTRRKKRGPTSPRLPGGSRRVSAGGANCSGGT